MIFLWLRRLVWFCLLLGSLGTTAGCLYYYHVQSTLPNVESLRNVTFETPLRIYTSDNKLLAEFGEHRRIPKKIDEIPQQLKNAFLAIEDSRFYQHFGIDPIGIMRAASVSFATGRKAQGASTITQQVARNFFLSNEKTYTRKIKEIFLSWKIEQTLSKDEIFELYLNKIALGHHAYGVAAAAYVYFGKELNELTLGEAAILAGLPKAPSNLNPITNPKRAQDRRHLVLNRMLELGFISQEEFNQADKEEIKAHYHTAEVQAYAPYIAESVRIKMEATYGPAVYTDGFRAYTTINSELQSSANQAVIAGITEYDKRHGFRKPFNVLSENNLNINDEAALLKVLKKKTTFETITPAIVLALDEKNNKAHVLLKNKDRGTIEWADMKWARSYHNDSYQGPYPKKVAQVLKVGDLIYVANTNREHQYALRQVPEVQSALISIDTKTGAILAMVGGYSYKQSHFNRVEQAKRQAGSNIKPFLYSAALANGYTLGSQMLDERITIWNAGSKRYWSPKNSPNRYEGWMPLRKALAKSKNVVSVRLIRALGINNFVTHFEKFGFHVGRYQKNDTLALGAFEVKPIELVTGYAAFANGGYKVEPYLISKVIVRNHNEDELIFEAYPNTACAACPDVIDNQIVPTVDQAEADLQRENGTAPQILTHDNAFLTASALSSVIFGGTDTDGRYWGTGGKATELKRSDIAGKTGTTNESRDAWFSGFNANVVTTVWVGFDDFSRSLGRMESGGKSALPIWISFMREALKDQKSSPVALGPNIIQTTNLGYPEYFIKGTELIYQPTIMEEEDFSTSPAPSSGSSSIEDIF